MSTRTETVTLATPEERWAQWQIRGQLQDRRSRIRARAFATVAFSGLLVWLVVELLSRT